MPTVAPGLRVVAALAAGARPAARRRSSVVHLYVGPISRTGRYATVAGRVLCGVRCLRLPLLQPVATGLELGGRRFCRRCTSLLPASLGRDVHRLVTRDDSIAAYGHLTVADFAQAAAWTRTVEETYQVGHIASAVLGPPKRFGHRDELEQAVYDLDRVLIARRDRLRLAERTPDEVQAARTRKEMQDEESERARQSRIKAYQDAKHQDRLARGQYTTPWERQRAASRD